MTKLASLYIHIPFCKRKCVYCSFSSCVATYSLIASYVQALLKELAVVASDARQQDKVLQTIFIGGGTPTCIQPKLLSSILQFCRGNFLLTTDVEISVEANPETVDEPYLEALMKAGMSRLSLGVQTFDDELLLRLGRLHSNEGACRAVVDAKRVGCKNINLDLMYGLPGQSPENWKQTLDTCFNLEPQHLSLYQLTVEENTPIHRSLRSGDFVLPSEKSVLIMDDITSSYCSLAGFEKYEISNYCASGYRCMHNINYWRNNEYYGVGASAVSYLNGCRKKRDEDPEAYTRAVLLGEESIVEEETLDRERSFRETVIMGLRMVEGVSLDSLHQRYGIDPREYYDKTLLRLLQEGLMEATSTHLRISEKGWQLSNRIMAELV